MMVLALMQTLMLLIIVNPYTVNSNFMPSASPTLSPSTSCAEFTPIGCSDGTREAFVNMSLYPYIAGCLATWHTPQTMSGPRSSISAICGNEAGDCSSPADACAVGWSICPLTHLQAAVRNGDECLHAGWGSFLANFSHCIYNANEYCEYDTLGTICATGDRFCAQAVCCGELCRQPGCRDGVWLGSTLIDPGYQGCGYANSTSNTSGVLCCADLDRSCSPISTNITHAPTSSTSGLLSGYGFWTVLIILGFIGAGICAIWIIFVGFGFYLPSWLESWADSLRPRARLASWFKARREFLQSIEEQVMHEESENQNLRKLHRQVTEWYRRYRFHRTVSLFWRWPNANAPVTRQGLWWWQLWDLERFSPALDTVNLDETKLYFVPWSEVKKFGNFERWPRYEELKVEGRLVEVDATAIGSMKCRPIFVSHKWAGSEPDTFDKQLLTSLESAVALLQSGEYKKSEIESARQEKSKLLPYWEPLYTTVREGGGYNPGTHKRMKRYTVTRWTGVVRRVPHGYHAAAKHLSLLQKQNADLCKQYKGRTDDELLFWIDACCTSQVEVKFVDIAAAIARTHTMTVIVFPLDASLYRKSAWCQLEAALNDNYIPPKLFMEQTLECFDLRNVEDIDVMVACVLEYLRLNEKDDIVTKIGRVQHWIKIASRIPVKLGDV